MIRLHHCHETRSMRVLWLLNEMGVEFELKVYPFDATLRQPEFMALSPAGRVPALEIDELVMFESGAMLEYLCEVFPETGLGRVSGDSDRAEWLVWLHFAETLSQHCASLNQQHNFIYPPEARSPVIIKLESKRAEKCFAAIERQLSDGRAFLLASGFSAADIAVGQAVFLASHFVPLTEFPLVEAWFSRLKSRPAYRKSLPQQGEMGMFDRSFYPAHEE